MMSPPILTKFTMGTSINDIIIRLMVGTIYNKRKKGIPRWCQTFAWEGNYSFRRTFFSSRQLSLSSISGLKDCLASLRSADNCPSSLRSRKVKVVSRKKKFVFICIPSLDKSLSPWRNYYSFRCVLFLPFLL